MEKDKEEKIHTNDVIAAGNYLFTKFHLSDKLLKSLNEMNYIKPSPIQLKIIPLARSRLDMIIQSKSGTGKTLTFSICLLETYDEEIKFPQAIVLVPTREIAVQVSNTLNGLGKYMKHFKACEFIGGTDLKNDRKRIQTTKIVVGTPGRILHLIKNEIFNTSNVKAIVFDEADKLFEQGHIGKEVQSIFRSIEHKSLQIIASTATVSSQFEAQIKTHMKNPIGVTPKHEVPVLLGIKQFVIELPQENDNIQLMRNKLTELEKVFTKITFKQCLLFTDSQTKTESYGNYLNKLGWKNEIINGSQEQSQRLKVLNKLAKFKCRILISTDLMARGIDIENINLIINLDLPYDCFSYLHRIGRAGRFGTYGIAVTLLNGEKDTLKFQKMLNEIGTNDSMVFKFPKDSVPYNFWDFNNQEQNYKLLKFETMSSDQNNGHILNGRSEEKSEDEIIDENLMLLEITKKLVDPKIEQKSDNYDTEALLNDYERACASNGTNLINEKENESNQNGLTKENGQHMNGQNLTVDSLLEEYERTCQNYSNKENHLKELETENSPKEPLSSQSPREKRCIVFVRNPKEDEELLSLENVSSDSEESYESEEYSEDEDNVEDENVEYQNHQQNDREFSQLNGINNEYHLYNQYVMENYLQWRRTYFFQLANIQNYVNHNREEFF